MQKTYSISKTQRALIADAQAEAEVAQRGVLKTCQIILAVHDIPKCKLISVNEDSLTVELPDEATNEPTGNI